MINLIRDTGALMNEGNLWNFYVKERKVNLGYIELDPASYRTKVTVSDQEVADMKKKKHPTGRKHL